MQNYRRGYPVGSGNSSGWGAAKSRPFMTLLLIVWQNLTDDECSEDKMNNLQFYLNKYPSAPDGKRAAVLTEGQCLGRSVW